MIALANRIAGKDPQFTRYSLDTVVGTTNISHAKATAELGWEPRPMGESIADTVRWWREHPLIVPVRRTNRSRRTAAPVSGRARVAVVTGASSGIGALTARRLAGEGFHVVLVARRRELLDEIARQIRDAGGMADVLAVDLARPEGPQAVFDHVMERYRGLDVLVNNAGFGWYGYTSDMPWVTAQDMIQVNNAALVQLIMLFLPVMRRADQGHIVNVSSVAGSIPSQGVALYSATKSFVDALTTLAVPRDPRHGRARERREARPRADGVLPHRGAPARRIHGARGALRRERRGRGEGHPGPPAPAAPGRVGARTAARPALGRVQLRVAHGPARAGAAASEVRPGELTKSGCRRLPLPGMKITRIRTIQAPEQPHILWLQVYTDEGIVGLGETYHNAHAIRAMLVQEFAPRYLIGKDPLAIEETWRAIHEWTNFAGWAGAEARALSAIDIALWDILGQATGRPVWQLLGGRVAPRIPVYNTCGTWGALDFMKNPAEFARRLLALGIRGMKIWPFDEWGRKTNGGYLHPRDLEQAIRPVEAIRDAVGRDMDLAMEFH